MDREATIMEILVQWATDEPTSQELEGALVGASDSQLEAIRQAESYPEVVAILGGDAAMAGVLALGDTDQDYTFTPVTPCRIVDTRIAGGIMTPGSTRSFYVYGSGGLLSGQGGDAAGCSSPVGEPRGAMLNITAVPQSDGHFRVYPQGSATPNASILNYRTGVNIANAAAVRTGYLVGHELEVYSSASSHLVIDVLGYYSVPGAAPPDQYVTSSGLTSIDTGTQSIWSPACPSGYRLSGGGGGLENWTSDVPMVSTRPVSGETIGLVSGSDAADRYICQFNNRSGSSRDVYCLAICVRTPGR